MANTFNLPVLGENIESGTIMTLLVKAGDTIEVDQAVLELETDKAVVEVPCSIAGTITEVHINEGDVIEIGAPVLTLEDGDAAPAKAEKKETPAKEEATKATPEPAKVEAPAPVAPKVAQPSTATVPKASKLVRAAPSARKFAREIGVDIAQVTAGTANKGISIQDVKDHAKKALSSPSSGAGVIAVPLPDFERFGTVRREAMSNIRKVTMQSMTRSWTTIPHVTQQDKADITELEIFRKTFGGPVQQAGGKLTATAILVKVMAEGLKRFPDFNASIDAPNAEIIYKDYYNIGIAVDTEHGLMVPVLKNVDQKSITDIALELTDISQRARSRKLGLDDLQGACITITNLGGIGGTSFTPIVNSPEVAILGVSRSTMEPVYIDGEFVPRNLIPLSLSYDHRAIDGANAARFTRWICTALEHPMSILLN